MKYSLYAELLQGNPENIDFNEKEFCDKLQAALQLKPGHKFISNKAGVQISKTIKTAEGQTELIFHRYKSESGESIISVGNIELTIHYNREQKKETTISSKNLELASGVYKIDRNKIMYYDRDARDYIKGIGQTQEFNTIKAASYGIVPDKEAEIENPIQFFTNMYTLSIEQIDTYLQEFVSQTPHKHSK